MVEASEVPSLEKRRLLIARTTDTDLEQDRFGLRFLSPATEKKYREWRNEQTLPLLKLVAGASLLAWLAVAIVGTFWWGINYFEGRRLWVMCFIIGFLAFGLFVEHTPLRRWGLQWACAGLVMIGWLGVVVLCLADFHSVGGAVAIAVVFSMWIPFIRIPPLLALCSMSTYSLPAAMAVLASYREGALSAMDAWTFLASISTTFFIVAATAVTLDRLVRQTFSKEQVVERQQSQLEHSRDLIRRYVPPTVAAHIVAGDESAIDKPQRHRLTILFSDIVGFTDIADRAEPEVITQVVNEYMATMAELIDAHRGTVNEFTGDGLMALFGAPDPMEPNLQARNAIQAAQAMQKTMPDLNRRWRKLGLGEELKIRIGINTGMASAGSYGSTGRMTYTAIGLQTNIAARIQSHCEPGSILISDATWQLVNDEIECASKGDVQCKGVHFPVAVYSPKPQ